MAKAVEPTPGLVPYANGVVKMPGLRDDGEMHGDWLWNRVDGLLMRTGQFDRGRQTGVWRTYDRPGSLVKETDFTKRP